MRNTTKQFQFFKPVELEKRPTGDYVTSKIDSMFLCRSIEKYYANQGYYGAKAWVEESIDPVTGFPTYSIRSNLKFDCKTIG